MASASELAILITAKDQASAALDKVGGALGSFGGLALGASAVAATALVGLGAAAYQLGSEFDDAYDRIRTGTGATGDRLVELQFAFREVAQAVPEDFGQISTAITEVTKRVGGSGQDVAILSTRFLELSRVTGEDMTTSIANVTRLFGDWSVATEDQETSMDLLYRTSQATGIGVNALSAKMVQFGAPLRAMGFDMADAAAMMGKWEKEGVNAELVLGSLRIAMGHFAKDGVPMREGLDDTIEKIQKLGPGAKATALAMEIFGARAGPDMAAAILEGRFEYQALLDQITNGEDTIHGAAEETADFAEKWGKLSNQLKVMAEPMSAVFFTLASTLIDELAPAFLGMVNVALNAMETLIGIVNTAVEGDLSTAFNDLVRFAQETGESLATVFVEWAQAFVAWVVEAGPPMLEQLGTLGRNVLTWLADQLPGVIEQLASWGAAFLDWVGPQIPGLLSQLLSLSTQVLVWMAGTALPAIVEHLNKWGQAFIDWIVPRIPGILMGLGQMALELTAWIFSTGVQMTLAAAQGLGGAIIQGFIQAVSGGSGQVASAITSMANQALNAAKSALGIASPSKEFEKLGDASIDGLVVGISKTGKLSNAMKATLGEFLSKASEYLSVAGRIAGVEGDISRVRKEADTAGLFRAEKMITLTSEELRLRRDLVTAERDLLPARQALDSLATKIAQTERGSLADRQRLIEIDGERNRLRLSELQLEGQLEGLRAGSKAAEMVQKQIDALRQQEDALRREADTIRLTNEIATTTERMRQEAMKDTLAANETEILAIKRVIDTLKAEGAVFDANENIIKNATANEVAYRQRLIAVFEAEALPLKERIRQGLALIEQLRNEGSISEELATKLRGVVGSLKAIDETKAQINVDGSALAKVSEAVKKLAANFADAAEKAAKLGGVTSGKGGSVWNKIQPRAEGGPINPGQMYVVGERGPELFVSGSSGSIVPNGGRGSFAGGGGTTVNQFHFHGAIYGAQDIEDTLIRALNRAADRGRLPLATVGR